ncbi:MAG: hypothetical protein N4A72_21070 [Bacteroidales bacterium]|jgi:hypothetical protein|nr:hypothetical protein [Bacteroidales bacterium]
MQEYEKIAQGYVESFGEVLPGFKFRVGEQREFVWKYYYDFVFVALNGKVPEEPPLAGGACGFTIDKGTKEIEMLTFSDLETLKEKEEELTEIYLRVTDIKNESKSFSWLKSKYDLTSKELLRIKKIIMVSEFDRKTIIEEIENIIATNR